MGGAKTAISLDEELFNEVDKMAKKMKISRSKLFVIAIRDFLKKSENQALFEKLNAAYSDSQTEEKEVSKRMKSKRLAHTEQESW
jgi:metal-responsive CopG/Arc/MetJ family transcriptional regulator